MRSSFVLYTSYQEQIELLTMEQRGVLLTAIMSYSSGQELPEMDGVTQMAFSFIRADLDRDADKYEKTCEARKEAGKMGGRPKANGFSENQTKAKKAKGFSENQSKAKKPDNDNEYDNDSKETLTNVSAKKGRFTPPTIKEVQDYIQENGYAVNAEAFVSHYQSNGWYVGKTKMKDWQASVRSWNSREGNDKKPVARSGTNRFNNFPARDYDYEELERQLLTAQGV